MSNYRIESTTDSNGKPCIKVSWAGQGPATTIKVGIQNSNNFTGYGYGMSYGSTNACSDGGWGSGIYGVSQASFPGNNQPGLTLPIFIRPCFLTTPGGEPPQGMSLYSSISPSGANPTATAAKDGDANAGIMIGITNGGSGGPGEE